MEGKWGDEEPSSLPSGPTFTAATIDAVEELPWGEEEEEYMRRKVVEIMLKSAAKKAKEATKKQEAKVGGEEGDGCEGEEKLHGDGGRGGMVHGDDDEGKSRDEGGGTTTVDTAAVEMDRDWDMGLKVNCYGDLELMLMHPDRRLDNGGFGVVYQMQTESNDDDPTNLYYAVKRPKRRTPAPSLHHAFTTTGFATLRVSSITNGGGAEMSKAMQEEAQIILQVPPHENVLDLVDSAHVNGVPVLVTLWGDGGSLSKFLEGKANGSRVSPKELLQRVKENRHSMKPEGDWEWDRHSSGGLSTEGALDLAIQLCRGLRHLHDNGVVHYDLKPANIIIFTPKSGHNNSKQYVLKVADFGLSRGLKDWLGDGTTPESGVAMAEHNGREGKSRGDGGDETGGGSIALRVNGGTSGYRAPELGMSQNELMHCGSGRTAAGANKAVDVWALGLVVGYLSCPAMWKRGAWVEADRRRKRQLLSANAWQEGIAVHRAELTQGADEMGKGAVVFEAAAAAGPQRGMVTNVALLCLALTAADRPSVADCEARLCAIHLERSSSLTAQQQAYPAVTAIDRADLTLARKREARFWSYLFGTPDARDRACQLWEALPKSDRENGVEMAKDYFKILVRCRGSAERTARAVALLEQMEGRLGRGNARLTEVGAFNFACRDSDDNVLVVQGYLEVLVERSRVGGCVAVAIGGGGACDSGGGGAEDQGNWMCVVCETANENDQHECQCCGESLAQFRAEVEQSTFAADDDGVIRADIVRRADASNRNRTALHWACMNGHLEVARLLVEVGGVELVMAGDDTKFTALHYACQEGHLVVARLLVEVGGEELVRVMGELTALQLACSKGHLEVARFLVEVSGVESVTVADNADFTALHYACCFEGHLAVARLLVAVGGIELVRAVTVIKDTALHFACVDGKLEVARLLIDAGGVELVRAVNDKNSTALHTACMNGHLEVARLLVEVGGVELVRADDVENTTALHMACIDGQLELVRLLIDAGGVELVRAGTDENSTALHAACMFAHLEVAHLLIETGGVELVRAVDDDNHTALHFACQSGNLEIVRLLLAKGGLESMGVKAMGNTPVDMASECENTDIVRLLNDEKERATQEDEELFSLFDGKAVEGGQEKKKKKKKKRKKKKGVKEKQGGEEC